MNDSNQDRNLAVMIATALRRVVTKAMLTPVLIAVALPPTSRCSETCEDCLQGAYRIFIQGLKKLCTSSFDHGKHGFLKSGAPNL